MKKKVIGILLFFISVITLLFVLNTTANPGNGDGHNAVGCHPGASPWNTPGGYTIAINTTSTITSNGSSVISIEINATGSNLFMRAYPGSWDNDLFGIFPTTDEILDNDGVYDTNPSSDEMTVVFNITTPAADRFYNLFIIAGDNSDITPDFAYANIGFSIGGVLPVIDWIGIFFSHTGFFVIGGMAIITLAVGTVLYLVNQEKFVKSHGLLAGTSLILTTVNMIAVIPTMVERFAVVASTLNLTLLHIILGVIGYAAGIIAFLAGLSGHRSRIPGFIALACWSFNYIQGIFSILGVYIL